MLTVRARAVNLGRVGRPASYQRSMPPLRALAAAAAAAFVAAAPGAGAPSRPLGLPWAGALANGVRLPAAGRHFFTWDPVLRRSPDRPWRRYGTGRLVRVVLRVVDGFAAAHPGVERVGIGDLSRPHGGDFGMRYGLPGHVSHQNGLDVDVYYPRRDHRERPPGSPSQIARPLAQDLVDRFVRAGAVRVFVGPNTGLTGPPGIVQVLANHDNHMHVRIGPPPARWRLLGRSERFRPIRFLERGNPHSRRVLVVGCIHGTECAGRLIVRLLAGMPPPLHLDLWLLDNLNPDGLAGGTRQNGRGVDLNRNFPSEWRPIGRRWDPQYSGPRPLSERETRLAYALILRLRPAVTLWFHQPQGLVRAWGHSIPVAREYARLAHVPFRPIRWPAGTAPNWQNHRFRTASSFVVELPPGPLSTAAARRYARAVTVLLP
jgi:Penicillin-insensitive murein endopeptidase/Zinc carboxypeptidase